jgi:hypothetical protein
MVVEPLLALYGAPNLYAVLDEPFHHKGRFIVLAAQAVKHIDQQNFKLALHCIPLHFLDSVTLFRGDLEAGNAFFVKLICQDPLRVSLDELPAILPLHGDIILFHLPDG